MAQIVEFPKRVAGRAASVAAEPLRHWPVHSVDDFGRDPHLVDALTPFARLRWNVGIGGSEHLPSRGGALMVCNSRRWALSSVYTALALGAAVDRPVRFVGRPDIAPIGPFMRRIGGLLARHDEVLGALRNHELVIMSCASSAHARHAGTVDHSLVGAAVLAHVPVFPVATMSSAVGRTARAEVGPQVRPRTKRKGPLAEVELAEQVQHHLQRMLDAFGGMQTGVAPLDWLAEG
jgi:1-acyl-sn-glycerol-3-phosphate acyltransferase